MSGSSLSIVLPVYLLETSIRGNVATVFEAVPAADEIVVVDDGSTDGTGAEIDAIAASDDRVIAVHHPVNRGKGAALVTGFGASSGDVIIFLDGDLDIPPHQLPDLLQRMEASGADVLVGSKHTTMDEATYPLLRRVLSRVFTFITSRLFRLPVTETQTGVKIFRRAVLDVVLPDLMIIGYAFDLELILRADRAGYVIVDSPVTLRPGASSRRLRPRILWEMGRDTIRILLWDLRARRQP